MPDPSLPGPEELTFVYRCPDCREKVPITIPSERRWPDALDYPPEKLRYPCPMEYGGCGDNTMLELREDKDPVKAAEP